MARFDKEIDAWTGIAYAKNPENVLSILAVKIVERRNIQSMDLETCIPEKVLWHQGFIAGIDFVLRLPTQKAGTETEDIDSEKENEN